MRFLPILASLAALSAAAVPAEVEQPVISAEDYAQLEELRVALRRLQAASTTTQAPLDPGGLLNLVLPPAVSGAPLGIISILLKLLNNLLKVVVVPTTTTTTTGI